jgi:hypothetical protein
MIDVCMMNEPEPSKPVASRVEGVMAELAAISRCIKLWDLMSRYIPTSQYVWSSSVLISHEHAGV